ncbi:MAG: DUF4350 domain-containing protein, partial [Planctomycetota bacterium]
MILLSLDVLAFAIAAGLLSGVWLPAGAGSAGTIAAMAAWLAAIPRIAAIDWRPEGRTRAGGILRAALPLALAGAAAIVLGRSDAFARLPALSLLFALLAALPLTRPMAATRLAAASAAALAASALEILRLAGPLSDALPAVARTISGRLGSLSLGLPLVAAVALWILAGAWIARRAIPASGSGGRRALLAAALALAAAGALLCIGTPRGERLPGKVLLSRDGYFRLPGASAAEPAGGPPFGLLLDLLESRGTPAEIFEGPVTDARLAEARTLVMINPRRRLAPIERGRIDAWVRGGGRLLILADHTNLFGMMDNLNPLLSPMGISLRFDSTCPDGDRESTRRRSPSDVAFWRRGIESFRHPVALGLRTPGLLRTGIGCSLALSGPSRPILEGQRGFADEGDSDDPSFLGNRSPDPWEPRGDLVLWAEADRGRGRLIVLGDTISLSDDAIPYDAPAVLRLFDALESDKGRPKGGVAAILLLAGLLAASLLPRTAIERIAAPAALFAAVAAGGIAEARAWRADLPAALRPPIAVVDLSHHPIAEPDFWNESALDGLYAALRREGFFPVAMESWNPALVARARAIVLPASRARFGERARRDLAEALERGAVVVAAVGANVPGGTADWLESCGLAIEGKPLGPASKTLAVAGVPAPVFREAWPLRIRAGGGWGGIPQLRKQEGEGVGPQRPVGARSNAMNSSTGRGP